MTKPQKRKVTKRKTTKRTVAHAKPAVHSNAFVPLRLGSPDYAQAHAVENSTGSFWRRWLSILK